MAVCETKFETQTWGEEWPGNKATRLQNLKHQHGGRNGLGTMFDSSLCCFLCQCFLCLQYTAVETATKALQLVNGYVMRGKPVIIVYGRGDSSS